MVRKEKWEREFEEYDKQSEVKKINELKSKFENKSITKEEYNDLKNSIAKYKNIEKVSNIIEYKKQLEASREKLNKEIKEAKKYQDEETKNKEAIENNEKLEKELNEIQEELSSVSKKLKAKDLSEEERKELEDKKAKLVSKKEKNNKEYAKNQEKMAQKSDNKESRDIEKIEKEKEDLGIKIGKCCFVGKMLMAGKSWEFIEVKYEQNKKYTDKNNNLASKIANQNEERTTENADKAIDETIEETGKEIGKEVERINNDEIEKDSKKQEEVALVEQTEFQRKHPKLAKIFSSVKNFFNKNKKMKNVEIETVKEEIPEIQEKKEEIKKEIPDIEEKKEEIREEKSQRDEFLDYLKVVSEKGVDKVKKENAQQKFAENKKAAYIRETNKFGKDYADMSYKEDEEKEID